MDALVYPHERSLGRLTLVLGLIAWVAIIVGTFGLALVYVLMAFIAYVFTQSAFISWIRGTAVKLSPQQFPDLFERFENCCKTLGMQENPEAYIVQGNGALNAFATRFFGRNFVVLHSEVVDALANRPEAINFYFGHEIGHIRMKHLTGFIWRLPVLWLPLLGAAYSRAKEYTCDLHGRACCADADAASRALIAIAAGSQRWETANLGAYASHAYEAQGFWSSFHELIGAYPWLTKRVAKCLHPEKTMAGRNPLAYVLALFVPYGGRAGGGLGGVIVVVAIIGILAAIALPAYQDYTHRAVVAQVWSQAEPVRRGLARYYASNRKPPGTLEVAGVPDALPSGAGLTLNAENMVVEVETRAGSLLMVPQTSQSAPDGIAWTCHAGTGMRAKVLPASCRENPAARR